jgi:hypothetical protein
MRLGSARRTRTPLPGPPSRVSRSQESNGSPEVSPGEAPAWDKQEKETRRKKRGERRDDSQGATNSKTEGQGPGAPAARKNECRCTCAEGLGLVRLGARPPRE